MNRQVPPSLRGIPAGFGGQQQPQQAGRSVSTRIPNGGKLGANGSGWAFGGGVPMGGAGLQNAPRQVGGNVSFAQSLGGSQPATPLDPSEFPSLSNSSQMPMPSQSGNMWSSGGGPTSRGLGGQPQRQQSTPLSAAAQGELYSPSSSRLPAGQNSFQFGGRSVMSNLAAGGGPSSQVQPSTDDAFPPLNRTAASDAARDRGPSLMSSIGFGHQGAPSAMSNARGENGLLSAISASSRATETRSPPGQALGGATMGQDTASTGDGRQKSSLRENSLPSTESQAQTAEGRNPLGAIGNAPPASAATESREPAHDEPDPLPGMSAEDRYGIAGLRRLMEGYPDYAAASVGLDPSVTGLDMNSTEKFSTQNWNVFDDQPPRPAIPPFKLPDCYNVTNTQPVDTKMPNFAEETLFYIFYTETADIKQILAAQELNARNWRWHKRMRMWLTKDEQMMPVQIAPNVERGWYIVWNPHSFRRERRELQLQYADLDTSLTPQG